ncbi:MAG TPA: PAS domain S-box protein, partial [Burkholderiales bacterium]
MALRKLNPGGKRLRIDQSRFTAAERASIRHQVLLECTRTLLRARNALELGPTLCRLLLRSELYTEASIGFSDDVASSKKSAVGTRDVPPGHINVPLRFDGSTLAVLTLCTSNNRQPDEGELEQLQVLADDAGYAISRLPKNGAESPVSGAERGLRETVEHAGVGITRIDADGKFVDVNHKFCQMLGYARDELIGRATRDFT